MSSNPITGHCLCGAVQFAYEGEPNWTAHCHCESCRRATSSPITTWISVPRDAFSFTAAKPQYFRSSPQAQRSFCAACGSPMTYEPDDLPDEVHIYAASLVNPSNVEPTVHVFTEEQLPWFEVQDRLPRYATSRKGGADPVSSGPAKK